MPGLNKTDKLNGIGVSTTGHYPLMPQSPSFEEQGLKPLDFSIWSAFMQTSKKCRLYPHQPRWTASGRGVLRRGEETRLFEIGQEMRQVRKFVVLESIQGS